jgi:putative ABC transport system permease protein
VFVGAFIIYNTLSITVAQRTRELALLRALGGSRRQVRRTVTAEALAIGSVASFIGVFAGLFLAKGLANVFSSGGLALPQSGTEFATRTWIVAVLVGVLVTLVASLSPARRATRVAPVAAMRDPSTIASPALDRRGPFVAVVTFGVGFAMLAAGAFVDGLPGGLRFLLLLPGTFVLFTGVALLAPRLVGPLASVLGAPAARFGGSAGRLAQSNATRNPRRTATTASALMIGIALVAFVAVLGHGINTSATDAIEGNTRADYVVQSQDGWTGVDPAAVAALGGTPGIEAATPVVLDEARSFGDTKTAVAGVDPQAFPKVYGLDWKHGDDSVVASLDGSSAIVAEKYADKHDVAVGDRVQVRSATGKSLDLRVTGIYESPNLSPVLLGDVLISQGAFADTFTTDRAAMAFIAAGDASRAQLEASLAGFPDAKVFTKSEFATEQTAWIDDIAGIFYAMLALSVLISLFGIVNTLVLSVYERTRELGMLRAIGMTRRQVRRMVRHESVVTALIGAVMGTAVGLLLAAIVTGALSDEGLSYSVPVGSLVVFAVVAAVAGVLAAILPARRASRLNVLEALQYE